MAACGSPMWGMNQSGVREGGKPYANMFFYNGGMGGNTQRDGVTCLSWPSNVSLDLDRDQRAHRAAALPSQEAARRFGRPRPSPRRPRPGDPDREPQRDADRRLLPRRAHDLPGLRHRGRQGRRAGRTARSTASQTDPKKQYVLQQGRHRLPRHAGRRRPWRSKGSVRRGRARGGRRAAGYVKRPKTRIAEEAGYASRKSRTPLDLVETFTLRDRTIELDAGIVLRRALGDRGANDH